MKYSYFICIILAIPSCLWSQDHHNTVLWQGFEFRWLETNHRLGKICSRVRFVSPDSIDVINSSEVGTKGDGGRFWNHLTYLHADSLYFLNVSDTFRILGNNKSGISINKKDTILIKYDANSSTKSVEAFINGFNLYSERDKDANKLCRYNLRVDTSYILKQKVYVVVSCSFLFKCTPLGRSKLNIPWLNKKIKSFECTDDVIDYKIVCDYLIVCGKYAPPRIDDYTSNTKWSSAGGKIYKANSHNMHANNYFDGIGLNYDQNNNLLGPNDLYFDERLIHHLDDCEDANCITGIKEMSYELDTENHFSYWSQFISPQNDFGYGFVRMDKSSKPEPNIHAGLYFSPWRYKIGLVYKLFSEAIAGTATLKIKTSTIKFRDSSAAIIPFCTFRYLYRKKKSLNYFYNTYTLDNILKPNSHFGTINAKWIY